MNHGRNFDPAAFARNCRDAYGNRVTDPTTVAVETHAALAVAAPALAATVTYRGLGMGRFEIVRPDVSTEPVADVHVGEVG